MLKEGWGYHTAHILSFREMANPSGMNFTKSSPHLQKDSWHRDNNLHVRIEFEEWRDQLGLRVHVPQPTHVPGEAESSFNPWSVHTTR